MEKWVTDIIRWFVKNFGKDIVILVKNAIQRRWRQYFASRNILILGAKQTGKSSLALFLTTGKPYEIVENTKQGPDPTGITAIIDKKFEIQKGNWLNLKA